MSCFPSSKTMRTYLAEEGLLEERNQWLVVIPVRHINCRECAFSGSNYEPSSRPCKRNYRFIGVYNRKTVAYVGTVEAIAVTSFQDDAISFTEEAGELTDDRRGPIATVDPGTRAGLEGVAGAELDGRVQIEPVRIVGVASILNSMHRAVKIQKMT